MLNRFGTSLNVEITFSNNLRLTRTLNKAALKAIREVEKSYLIARSRETRMEIQLLFQFYVVFPLSALYSCFFLF